MPDITMCYGKECPVKEKCYRFNVKPSDYQYYFTELPYDKKKKTCEYYWGENAQSIFEQIKDIIE